MNKRLNKNKNKQLKLKKCMRIESVEPTQGEAGYSTVEMAVTMLLLVMFSAAVFILSASASDTYQSLNHEKDIAASLRIASSYMMTKVRQNDALESVEVVEQSVFPENALVLKTTYGSEVYETWIYTKDGVLREVMVLEGTAVDDDMGFDIVALDAMALKLEDGGIVFDLKAGSESRNYYVALQAGEAVMP